MIMRPTTIKLAAACCPHAVTLYTEGAPMDRRIFATGTAAHEYLQAAAAGVDLDAITAQLVSDGRRGDDAEGPLPPDAVLRGLDLARAWLDRHGIPTGAEPETRYSLDHDGYPTTDHAAALVSTRIDLTYWTVEDTADGDTDVRVVRDYKSSWQADESELDTLQRRVQGVMLWTHDTDAAGIRLEVANIRSGAIYSRTLWRGVDDAIVDQWRADIVTAARALTDGPRTPSPGARCIGCPYAARACAHVDALASDGTADPVRRWAAARAIVTAVEPLARKATEHEPIDGIGWQATERRVLAPGAPRALLDAYTGIAGPVPDGFEDWAIGLVDALTAGASSVSSLGKVLWRGRGSKPPREALADAALTTKPGRRWGV